MNTISAKQLEEMQQREGEFLLVNTLDEQDFPATHIPDSVNIPQSQDEFAERVEREAGGRDKKVVVYCASEQCHSSTQAAEKLEAAGFSHVYDFEAGAEGWKQAGHELATS